MRLAPTPEAMVEHERPGSDAARRSAWALAGGEHHRGRAARSSSDFDGEVPDTELELRSLPGRRRLRRPGRALLRLRPPRGAARHQHRAHRRPLPRTIGRRAAGSCASTSTASPGAEGPTRRSTTRCSTSARSSAAPGRRAATSARSRAHCATGGGLAAAVPAARCERGRRAMPRSTDRHPLGARG